jgi:hypothetical protein
MVPRKRVRAGSTSKKVSSAATEQAVAAVGQQDRIEWRAPRIRGLGACSLCSASIGSLREPRAFGVERGCPLVVAGDLAHHRRRIRSWAG